jgi:hypothetical protein
MALIGVNACNIWRKSRYSIGNGECVEVAAAGDSVMVRDSAQSTAPFLSYSTESWQRFLSDVKAGTFDPSC